MNSKNAGRSRISSRLARRQNRTGDKNVADVINSPIISLGQNGQPLDEIDMMFDGLRSKMYPICAPLNKKVNTHNLANIPSLKSNEGNSSGDIENGLKNNESLDNNRKDLSQRRNANSLIESRNKFRQLLNQIQSKSKPMSNGNNNKNDTLFDGYELKSRKVKFEPRRSRRENTEHMTNLSRASTNCEYFVKLFDKTIDLSPYCKYNSNQYISLYPVCRIWARNNYGIPDFLRSKRNYPPPQMKDDNIEPDGPYSESPVDVYHLPKPEPLPRDENGNPINLRVPKCVRDFKPPRSKAADEINSMEHLSVKETLALNIPHWKYIKKQFLLAARENEKRYKHSFDMLKSMFDK
ncbi:cell cycle [Blomia tropicalis]|nr:cell cycle [Blomia tropicalis]